MFDTYLGFYDEGTREVADWEIKWLTEHGIDFIHACWYCPSSNVKAPIKEMNNSYAALHDGYMMAKYSHLLDFCIMWENSSQNCSSFEQFKEMVENEDMITILAEEGESVVGICMVSMRAKTGMVKRRTAYMEDLCVEESCRGKGIGKELFLFSKKLAEKMGAERLDLMVWDFNEDARKFYESMGMKPQRYIYETVL